MSLPDLLLQLRVWWGEAYRACGSPTQDHAVEDQDVVVMPSFHLQSLGVTDVPFHVVKEFSKGFSDELGRGAFAICYRGEMRGTHGKEAIAVKVFQEQDRAKFEREVYLMAVCKHPKVVRLLMVSTDVKLCLVMPFMPGSSLEHVLQSAGRLQSFEARDRVRCICDIFDGLSYLHTPYRNKALIVHCDIKPDNVLLDGNVAMLADLGVAAELVGGEMVVTTTRDPGCTEFFVCPEFARTKCPTPFADVYSAGVVLLQVLAGAETEELAKAFVAVLDPAQRWEGQQRRRGASAMADRRVQWPPVLLDSLYDVAVPCTRFRADKRPDSHAVHKHISRLMTVLEGSPAPAEAATRLPERSIRDCHVCMRNPREGMWRPCGHSIVCLDCANKVLRTHKRCPLCRCRVEGFESAAPGQ